MRRGILRAGKFASDWITIWNHSDAQAVLTHYADDVLSMSPLAATVADSSEVHEKDVLRAYWTKALRGRSSPPQFVLDSFGWEDGNRALLIAYVSSGPGTK